MTPDDLGNHLSRKAKKAQKMTPAIRRLIVSEAVRQQATSRTDLAAQLQAGIQARYGELAVPTLETLVKMISDARNHASPLDRPWHMGLLPDHPAITADAVRFILAVQDWYDHHTPRNQLLHNGSEWLSVRQALWIARLYRLVKGESETDVLELQRLSRVYAEYELMHELSSAKGEFDTTEIDAAVREGRLPNWLETQRDGDDDEDRSILNAPPTVRRHEDPRNRPEPPSTPPSLTPPRQETQRLPLRQAADSSQLGLDLEAPQAAEKKDNWVRSPQQAQWLLEALQRVKQKDEAPDRQLIPDWLRRSEQKPRIE